MIAPGYGLAVVIAMILGFLWWVAWDLDELKERVKKLEDTEGR